MILIGGDPRRDGKTHLASNAASIPLAELTGKYLFEKGTRSSGIGGQVRRIEDNNLFLECNQWMPEPTSFTISVSDLNNCEVYAVN